MIYQPPLSLNSSTLTTHPISVLLVDDQMIIGEAIRRMLENEKDIIFHYCSDPTKAIQAAVDANPTVILQDLVMPDIDGLLLVKYYRANKATLDIPLIVLSTKEDPKIKAEAFSLGANDYLVKLPDKVELIARIRYHSRAYILLLQRNEAYVKLKESQRVLYSELSEAAEYVKSQLPAPLNGEIKAAWKFIPSTQLGGDAFNYHWLDDNHFAMYLLDVCGHGIGAALLSISIMNVLRTQTLPNTDFCNPSNVLTALNAMFPMEKHNNMFFTMWYGVYDKTNRVITYASGGHPPALLLSGDNPKNIKVSQLKTPGLVIGGMPDTHYQSASCEVGKYNRLYIFSDGVYEMTKADRTVLSFDDFIKALPKRSLEDESDIERIVQYSQKVNENQPFVDDYSLVRFIFQPQEK